MRRVLVVDDDPAVRRSIAEVLSDGGIATTVAENGAHALSLLAAAAPDVVLSDVRMPDVDGLSLLQTLRERMPSVDVVLMTAYDDMPTVVAAMRGGAVEFLVKPLNLQQLRRVVDRVFEDRKSRRKAEEKSDAHTAEVEDLVRSSSAND